MALYAHPDDPEFFSGGLLAKFASEGAHLIYILATSGDKGSDDPEMTRERLIEMREAEQRNAANAAAPGNNTVIFLRYPDGELEPNLQLRRDLTRAIRQQKPDVVITNDPTARWTPAGSINHPDHIAIGTATLDAVYPSARDRHTFVELWRDEGLEPHKVRQVFLAGTRDPNFKVEITALFDRKLEAIKQHVSQVKDPAGLEKRLRDNTDAELSNRLSSPVYTEAYHVLYMR
jgi:LmbE family N-acetylglucosaminyl deacetylase